MAERWLVTGGTGQVGQALGRLDLPGVELWLPTRDQLDLANLPPLGPLLDGVAAIINCGAYTAVDRAESEPVLAHAINAEAPGQLAVAAAHAGIPIVHVSTDYVFAADGHGPWAESAPIAPASVYGRTKADGEDAVRTAGGRHAIVRTAWVISADGQNFLKTMLRLGAERDELRVVADQLGNPTHAGDLAAALAHIARVMVADVQQPSGTWHCTNSGETSWHGLAAEIFACAARYGRKVPDRLEAITSAEYPTPARRPQDSRLDTAALVRDFGIELRRWEAAVAAIVEQLCEKGTDAP